MKLRYFIYGYCGLWCASVFVTDLFAPMDLAEITLWLSVPSIIGGLQLWREKGNV